jgi:hypothetical protein
LFFQFFGSQFHFRKLWGNISAYKVKEYFHLLGCLLAAFAVTLMHMDFFYKLIKHGCCHGVKVFVLLNKGNKLVGRLAAFFKVCKGGFYVLNFLCKCRLPFGVLLVGGLVSCFGQLAKYAALLDFAVRKPFFEQ